MINLEGDDPKLVSAMLVHCYSQDYPAVQKAYRGSQGLVFDAQMLVLADKYVCPTLAKDIEAGFVRELSGRSLYELQALNGLAALDAFYCLPSGSLAGGTQKAFLQHTVHTLPLILPGSIGNAEFSEFSKLLTKHPQLGSDHLQSICDTVRPCWRSPYECSACKNVFLVLMKNSSHASGYGIAVDSAYAACPNCKSNNGRSFSIAKGGQWLVPSLPSKDKM